MFGPQPHWFSSSGGEIKLHERGEIFGLIRPCFDPLLATEESGFQRAGML